ncbi:hypothetical protein [Kocuria sp. KH4]
MTITHQDVQAAAGNDLVAAEQALRKAIDQHQQAEALLMGGDPIAADLYQAGFRAGIEEGERRAAERAEQAAAAFIDYLRTDPAATPQPVPPLDNDWRSAA